MVEVECLECQPQILAAALEQRPDHAVGVIGAVELVTV